MTVEEAFDDAAKARDEAGFIGTPADCIRYLDAEVQAMRDALQGVVRELSGMGHSTGNSMRALNIAKSVLHTA